VVSALQVFTLESGRFIVFVMERQTVRFKGFLALIAFVCAASSASQGRELPLRSIKLPPGFAISVYAEGVPNARSLSMSPKGTLFVGSREAGNVYALRDEDGDARAEKVYRIASRLDMPNGVAFRNGSLYVAEVSRILRFDDIENRLGDPPSPAVLGARFPDDRAHGWKFIRFGPDGTLYVPVGAPCNACTRADRRYATITRLSPDGSGFEIFARGVRNTVGFDWSPQTGELWFTDNGRDWLGDDAPPDELNRAPRQGLHFGFPYCHGGAGGTPTRDPELGKGADCSEYRRPEMNLGPHVAALGMRFYTSKVPGGMKAGNGGVVGPRSVFPAEYENQIFIAEHGSWNRSVPIGYRVTLVRVENDRAVSYETFAEGWLQGRDAWGRPVDLEILPDGSMLLSDDKAGAVYRIRYEGK
jgi:glucose/arabinose dehydrogenase